MLAHGKILETADFVHPKLIWYGDAPRLRAVCGKAKVLMFIREQACLSDFALPLQGSLHTPGLGHP